MIGRTLAHFEIVDLLGKGGMGEVYRARDTKLGRDVALKLLPREVAGDRERLARFEREAKLLANLSHPSIAGLYGLEEADGDVFLVMELAEGEDLSQRLRQGALPTDEALDLALQIAEALEAAHAKNIVHRDLKPANIMCSPDGRVKLLDFGLARAYHADEASGDPMMSPTLTAAMTQQGVILGTAAYMSPEQARGKNVDAQSDIWAFGVVLYEMLTAHRVFQGETISDSIGAILHKEPEWPRLPADTPPQVRQLLARCLERNPAERLHHIADARVAILDARRDPEGSRLGFSGVMPQPRRSRAGLVAAVTAVVGLALGLVLGPQLFAPQAAAPYRVLDLGVEISPSEDQQLGIQAVVSPDGSAVAYTHDGHLWVQPLDEHQPLELAQSEDAQAPFWSPDGTHLGWFQGRRIMKAPATGGRPVALCDIAAEVAGGVGAHWTADGRILFTTGSSGIRAVSDQGGMVEEIIPPGEGFGDLHEPFALPDGKGILFVSHPTQKGPSVLEIWRDGTRSVLFAAESGARIFSPCYDPQGYVLFRLTRTELTWGLWALPFDSGAGTATGDPFLVEADASAATITRGGDLVFVMNPQRAQEQVIVRVGFDGKRQEILSSTRANGDQFALSPDGRTLAFTATASDDREGTQVWVRDLARGVESQLTNLENHGYFEVHWTSDSRALRFIAVNFDDGTNALVQVAIDGSDPWTVLAEEPGRLTPDDQQLIYISGPRGEPIRTSRIDTTLVWLRPLDGSAEARQVLGGDAAYFGTDFSPGGRYLLYYENRAGKESVFLTRYPEFTGRWKVSRDADIQSEAFAVDGSAIFYVSGDQVFRVAFNDGPEPDLGRPEAVCALPPTSSGLIQPHPDGQSFLTVVDAPSGDRQRQRASVKYVQNWVAKLGGR